MMTADQCQVGQYKPQEGTIADQQVETITGKPVRGGFEKLVEARGKGDIVDLADGVEIRDRVWRDGGNGGNVGAGNGADVFYGASSY